MDVIDACTLGVNINMCVSDDLADEKYDIRLNMRTSSHLVTSPLGTCNYLPVLLNKSHSTATSHVFGVEFVGCAELAGSVSTSS